MTGMTGFDIDKYNLEKEILVELIKLRGTIRNLTEVGTKLVEALGHVGVSPDYDDSNKEENK